MSLIFNKYGMANLSKLHNKHFLSALKLELPGWIQKQGTVPSYKTFFMLSSAETKIYPAHKMLKCQQFLVF